MRRARSFRASSTRRARRSWCWVCCSRGNSIGSDRGEMMMKMCGVALAACLAVLNAHGGAAPAADLKIFGSRGTKMVIGDIGAAFERDTGHKLKLGTDVAAVIKQRLAQEG